MPLPIERNAVRAAAAARADADGDSIAHICMIA